jgi:hypothetical protein
MVSARRLFALQEHSARTGVPGLGDDLIRSIIQAAVPAREP